MAVLVGNKADIYIATGTGTSMTGEAVTDLTGGLYQITSGTKRALNPNATLTVLDGVATVPATAYDVYWGAGIIAINGSYTVGGTITVTGEYLSLSQVAQATEWTYDSEVVLEETQTFGDTWKEYTEVMRSGSVKFKRFYNDGYFRTNIGSYYVLALYLSTTTGARYLAAGQCTSHGVSAAENETVKEDVTFSLHGGVAYTAT